MYCSGASARAVSVGRWPSIMRAVSILDSSSANHGNGYTAVGAPTPMRDGPAAARSAKRDDISRGISRRSAKPSERSDTLLDAAAPSGA